MLFTIEASELTTAATSAANAISFHSRRDKVMHQPQDRPDAMGLLQGSIQGKSYDSGDHDDQGKNQFQQTGKDESHTGFRKAFACQGTLDDVLIASEIIQGTDPQSAQDDPDSRQIFIIRIGGIKDHVKLFRNLRHQFLHSGYCTASSDK